MIGYLHSAISQSIRLSAIVVSTPCVSRMCYGSKILKEGEGNQATAQKMIERESGVSLSPQPKIVSDKVKEALEIVLNTSKVAVETLKVSKPLSGEFRLVDSRAEVGEREILATEYKPASGTPLSPKDIRKKYDLHCRLPPHYW